MSLTNTRCFFYYHYYSLLKTYFILAPSTGHLISLHHTLQDSIPITFFIDKSAELQGLIEEVMQVEVQPQWVTAKPEYYTLNKRPSFTFSYITSAFKKIKATIPQGTAVWSRKRKLLLGGSKGDSEIIKEVHILPFV